MSAGLVVQERAALANLHTLGFEVVARYLVHLTDWSQLLCALELVQQTGDCFVLGNGSNVFFTQDYPGCVVHIGCKGITLQQQTASYVAIEVEAGTAWQEVVQYAVERNYWGVENLSSIPGTAGAAVVQNIGAYGMELSQTLLAVKAMALSTGKVHTFVAADCALGYRDSLFKKEEGWLVQSITLRLNKVATPCIDYPGVEEALWGKKGGSIHALRSAQIAQAIDLLRARKLPSVQEEANAGSFFKNPVLSPTQAQAIQQRFGATKLQVYPVEGGVKVSAAQLITACGLKGYRHRGVGVSTTHALVLVRYDAGTPADMQTLVAYVQSRVQEHWGVALVPEVCIC